MRTSTIMTGTRVLRIVFDGTRVTGVVIERAGEKQDRRGARGGGVGRRHSFADVVLRSGIGPADELRKLGIAVVADRPGVGRNYQNHPQLHFAMTLKRGSRMPAQAQHYIMASHRFSSGVDGGSPGDLFHYYTGRVSPKAVRAATWRWWRAVSTRRYRAARWRCARPIRMCRRAWRRDFSPSRSIGSA